MQVEVLNVRLRLRVRLPELGLAAKLGDVRCVGQEGPWGSTGVLFRGVPGGPGGPPETRPTTNYATYVCELDYLSFDLLVMPRSFIDHMCVRVRVRVRVHVRRMCVCVCV